MKNILFLAVVAAWAISLIPIPATADEVNLEYSTYLGGTENDSLYGLAVDSQNRLYLAGETLSSDFPTANPYQAGLNTLSNDIFAACLSSSGDSLIYSTYLGGSSYDYVNAIDVTGAGEAVLTGRTLSNDFPTLNPYQPFRAGQKDAFLSGLSSSGSSMLFSTYLGGNSSDEGNDIRISSNGDIVVTGSTLSSNFPTFAPFQAEKAGIWDCFITAFSGDGSGPVYSTYLGGSFSDFASALALNGSGEIHLTGETESVDFPTLNPYQGPAGAVDIFLSSLSSTGSSLLYSTYLGGSANDRAYGLSLDPEGRPFLCGETQSDDFPTVNPYQAGRAGASSYAIVAGFSSSGSSLVYSTYLGGGSTDKAVDIVFQDSGTLFILGVTASDDFPTVNPYQAARAGGNDIFLAGISSPPSGLLFSTYLGGSNQESGSSIGIDLQNRICLGGCTLSDDFPTRNPFQASHGGGGDAIITRLNWRPDRPVWIYDYNGDGTSDIAIFRGTSGLWAIRGVTRVYFGGSTDEAVPGDYNGDGTTDIGIYRTTPGLWAIRSTTRAYFGSGDDLPAPGDYDGDRTADMGIYRATSGLWAIRGITRVYFGGSADSPVPGYYDSDSTKDIGIFREATGLWAIKGISRIYFGSTGDETVPGDYDGDGAWDYGIFRSSSGLWAIRNVTRNYFGSSSDSPVPGDYDGTGSDDIGIFRESSGLWAIKAVTRAYFGGHGDLPVTR